jgi:acyl-CoA thioester hydrolase
MIVDTQRLHSSATAATPDWRQAHQWPVRVYYEDTDAGGVVFYANYLKFMERARTEWLRAKGVNQQSLSLTDRVAFVVSNLEMQYRAAARLDDALTIQSLVTQAGRASLQFAQRVLREDQVLAEGHIRIGCVDLRNFKPVGLPASVRDHFFPPFKR